MEYLARLDELPTVEEALKLPYDDYMKYAKGVLEYRDYCFDGFAEAITKVHEWCIHLNCSGVTRTCASLETTTTVTTFVTTAMEGLTPNASVFQLIESLRSNHSKCYDDYLCDHPGMSQANHYVLGFACFFLCLGGIVSNLVLLPAYNLGLNRSGATVYLTAMAVLDLLYLFLALVMVVSRYMTSDFQEQMVSYARFSARLVPVGLPLMQMCELVVVWLVVALLANRLMYLKFGCQAKLLCSQLQAFKSVAALIAFGVAYSGCKFLEYRLEEFNSTDVVRVVFTPVGGTSLYKNLMYHWLKVPLQMFLPYLIVGVLISVVVSKMLNLHTSKWKAVASLCNDTACACVCRTGVCGSECQEGAFKHIAPPTVQIVHASRNQSAADITPEVRIDQPSVHNPPSNTGGKLMKHVSTEALDPIEEELAYLFFELPHVDETREHANVVTAVCIGLLLLLFKLPKFLSHVLTTEDYIHYDPVVVTMVDHFLDTIFAACKPSVCILVGAHFRRVLLTPAQCCLIHSTEAVIAVRSPETNPDVEMQDLSAV
ncbi:hypothetical protein X801_09531 [Opisthorchis viverrini]|uniref:G-protein coupled receptors family 1 profile domain-containing protein n=1 Tax=Opisthorchis viverrini TaxID=6198 RepID=A0A1S8WJQ2_OPIVI|nr:hypothetical protein X801_09531 [Opisthorchis viverrini]